VSVSPDVTLLLTQLRSSRDNLVDASEDTGNRQPTRRAVAVHRWLQFPRGKRARTMQPTVKEKVGGEVLLRDLYLSQLNHAICQVRHARAH
jgi:hypothetical protein